MRQTLLPLLLIWTVACDSESTAPKTSTQPLLWARSADSSTLDPAEMEWTEDSKVASSIFETLVSFKDNSGELEPRLATKWEFSTDGKNLTFDLRTGVKFHDGTTFDAGDVVFSIERLMQPDHVNRPKTSPYAPNYAVIDSVKADGPTRVIFTLKSPSAIILLNLALISAAVVSPEAVQSSGAQWPVKPVGTGPYRLQTWDRDVRIVLERFADYWDTAPAIPKVIVQPVKSPQTALQALKRSEIHVVDHPTLADVKALQSGGDARVETETSMNVCYLGFNMKQHPYSDANFRRAVSLALDRSTLIDLAYYGMAEPSANIVPPAIWNSACPTPPYEHNLEKAREALAQVKLDSKEVELIHMTFARPYVPEPHRVAEFVKDQLRKIGLDVKLTGYDKSAYTVKTKEDDHPMFLLGWNADLPDPDNFLYPLLHGDSSADLNSTFFNDPEFNAAVTAAQTELDEAKRRAHYARAYARYRDQIPSIPLVHVGQMMVLSRNVEYDLHPFETRFFKARFRE